MTSVAFDLAAVAAMLISIVPAIGPIGLDSLNSSTPKPFLGSMVRMGTPLPHFKALTDEETAILQ